MSISQTSEPKSLGYKLKVAQHALRLEMDNALKALDLNTPQYAVLSHLEMAPGISNADLARASFVTPQTMHGLISNLEKNKLIKRKRDPQHGRIQCTELTAKGEKLVKQARTIVQAAEQKMTSSISKTALLQLDKILTQCIENLK